MTHRHFYTQTLSHTHTHFDTQRLWHTDAFTHRSFYTQRVLHTDTFTHKHFYTQRLLHTRFTDRRFYTNTSTRRDFYTQTLLHTDTFTHRRFYTQTHFTQTLSHAETVTDRHFYTNTSTRRDFYTHTLLQTDAFTQTLPHAEAFTHRRFYTQTLLHTDAFTHRRILHKHFHTQRLLQTDTFTQTPPHAETFTHIRFYRQTLLHKRFHTQRLLHRHFYTQTRLHTNTFTHTDRTREITSLPSFWDQHLTFGNSKADLLAKKHAWRVFEQCSAGCCARISEAIALQAHMVSALHKRANLLKLVQATDFELHDPSLGMGPFSRRIHCTCTSAKRCRTKTKVCQGCHLSETRGCLESVAMSEYHAGGITSLTLDLLRAQYPTFSSKSFSERIPPINLRLPGVDQIHRKGRRAPAEVEEIVRFTQQCQIMFLQKSYWALCSLDIGLLWFFAPCFPNRV